MALSEIGTIIKTEIARLVAAGREYEASHIRSCPICFMGFKKLVAAGLAPADATEALFENFNKQQ